MGQLWDRLRRVADSYVNDFTNDVDISKIDPKILEELRSRQASSSSASSNTYAHTNRRGYETEEERLKRMIDEAANPQGSTNGSQSSSSSSNSSKQQQRPYTNGGMTLEGALQALGLPPNASNDDIKRTYKKLMMQYHPDRVIQLDASAQNQARDKAQRVNQAYQIIKDAKGL
jgi:DnaJ-domain-containing protein 1